MKAFNPQFVRQAVINLGSQAELARLCGVTKESARLWFDGAIAPEPRHIDTMSEALGMAAESAWLEVPDPEPEPPADQFKRLFARRRRGCSLRAVSEISGVPLGTLSELKNGKRQPKPGQIEAIMRKCSHLLPKPPTKGWIVRESGRRPLRRCAMNLSDEVLSFYGLKEDPWRGDVRSDRDVFPTRDFQRIHKMVTRAVSRKDFAVVSGPTGAGKTDMTRRVLNEVSKRKSVKLVEILTPNVKLMSAASLCDALVMGLAPGARTQVRTEKLALQVVDVLREHQRQGNTPVIVLDDAHECGINVLRQLKRFWQFRSVESYEPLVGIILLGWPKLPLSLSNNPDLLEVTRRADIVELRGLRGEHADYVAKKLARVGCKKTIFGKSAIRALASVPSAQWPLPTNRIAARAMRLAYDLAKTRTAAQRGTVLPEDVLKAAEETV
jgi:type II secretory pathway predicted ATPase ExeA